jgi:ribonuclease R
MAMEAEREADDIKKAEYMRAHIGEEYSAVISSCTNFGIYAELENGIEGLIRLADLKDDYYVFNPDNLSLTGEHTGKAYRIGDSVDIIVASVDIKNINFELR